MSDRFRYLLALFIMQLSISSLYAADYEGQFHKALAWVNDATGTHLQVSLEIRPLDKDEMRALVANSISASPFASYDKTKKLLVVNPNACRSGLFISARTTQDIDNMLLLLFLHEVLHAYQTTIIDQHADLNIPLRVLRCICEGHAIVFSEIIAKAHGITTSITKNICPPEEIPFNPTADSRRAAILQQFTYTMGSRFVSEKISDVRDFEKLIGSQVTYSSICTLSQQGQKKPIPTTAATTPATHESSPTARIAASIKTQLCEHTLDIVPIDYLDSIAVVAPARFDSTSISFVFEDALWVQARHRTLGTLNIYIVSFTDTTVAKDVFDHSRSYFKQGITAKGGRVDVVTTHYPGWYARLDRLILAAWLQQGTIVFIEGTDQDSLKAIMDKHGEEK